MALIGLYLVAGALLVVAGAAKAVRPDDTARAMQAALPLPDRWRRPGTLNPVVRVTAVIEAVIGIAAVAHPAPIPAALVAVSYFAFAALLAVVRSRGGALASCGCFGRPDTPVTVAHVVIDLVLGLSAAVVAGAGPSGWIVSVLAGQPGRGAPLLVASAVATWLTILVMDRLARVVAVRRAVGIQHGHAARSVAEAATR